MTKTRQDFLLQHGKHIPLSELTEMTDEEFVVARWGAAGVAVCELAHEVNLGNIPVADFTSEYCTVSGGNWNAWMLSGIKAVSRKIFEAIPERMGKDSFFTVCAVLRLIGVDTAN